MDQLALPVSLRDYAVFGSYFDGPNAAAVHCLRSLTTAARQQVVWIWTPQPLGKTHLLQALCALAGQNEMSAGYLPLSLHTDFKPEVLADWGELGVVCLDDIHTIAGRTAWEEAVFRLFVDLTDRGTLVVTASASPAAVPFARQDLGSRLSWGPVFQLQPLNDDERIQALKLRAALRGISLPAETGHYLMTRFERDLVSLFRLLDTLDKASLAAQRRLSIPFVKRVLARISHHDDEPSLSRGQALDSE